MHQAQGTPAVRREIRFLLNDREVRLGALAPQDTLLDFLRIDRRLTGTKEGCAEGDCGACTVLVGRLGDGGLRYEAVNACIRFTASLDGCHVVTIEHLAGADGRLHPVQRRWSSTTAASAASARRASSCRSTRSGWRTPTRRGRDRDRRCRATSAAAPATRRSSVAGGRRLATAARPPTT
jgi:aerobic-type carbon monoxide dehydrogenase small subunit (CoxS/CutS family)